MLLNEMWNFENAVAIGQGNLDGYCASKAMNSGLQVAQTYLLFL